MEPKLALYEFLQHLVGRLAKSENDPLWVSAERALVECLQYEFLRATITDHLEELVSAYSQSSTLFRQKVTEILNSTLELIAKKLTSLQNKTIEPDNPLSPREVVERARSWQNTGEKLADARQQATNRRQSYIKEVVLVWKTELQKNGLELSPQNEKAVLDAANKLPPDADVGQITHAASSQLNTLVADSKSRQVLAATLETAAINLAPQLNQAVKTVRTLELAADQIIRTASSAPDIFKLDYLADLLIQNVPLNQAVGLTRVAQAVDSPLDFVEIISTGHFFRSLAVTPLQKLVAPLADNLLVAIKNPETKKVVVDNVLSGVLDVPIQTIDTINRRVGGLAAELVQNHPEFLNRLREQKTTSLKLFTIPSFGRLAPAAVRGPLNHLINIVTFPIRLLSQTAPDVSSSAATIGIKTLAAVFRSPTGRPHPQAVGFFETLARTGLAPLPTIKLIPSDWNIVWARLRVQFLTAATYRSFPDRFYWQTTVDTGADIARWVLRFGKKRAGKEAVVAVAKTATAEAATKGLAAFLTKLGLTGLGGIVTGGTSWLAQGLAFAGSQVLGLVGRGLTWLAMGGPLMWIMGESAEEKKTSWIMLLLVAVPILLIMLISGGTDTTRSSALVTGGGDFGPIPPGTRAGTFACTWTRTDLQPPTNAIRVCPVHAPITQGPFNPGGSHKNLDAYDFGANQGTEVLAAHDGFVTNIYNGFAPNEYQYGSYGNNVVLAATDPSSGQMYCTIYAHMLPLPSNIIAAHDSLTGATPTVIRAGDIVGYVDTTGYTYGIGGLGKGTHLHWGYRGPGRLALPGGCP